MCHNTCKSMGRVLCVVRRLIMELSHKIFLMRLFQPLFNSKQIQISYISVDI